MSLPHADTGSNCSVLLHDLRPILSLAACSLVTSGTAGRDVFDWLSDGFHKLCFTSFYSCLNDLVSLCGSFASALTETRPWQRFQEAVIFVQNKTRNNIDGVTTWRVRLESNVWQYLLVTPTGSSVRADQRLSRSSQRDIGGINDLDLFPLCCNAAPTGAASVGGVRWSVSSDFFPLGTIDKWNSLSWPPEDQLKHS